MTNLVSKHKIQVFYGVYEIASVGSCLRL
ncbi:hypothetical protein MTR67_013281 [Solanum verrucosum]|uniref:Uncharacterized protein n=1 Tax=Solanum verrucosum TaxID=315347 RepID=A0AAF0THT4_SOLVR|nr:hypothetical protein MTR67_013281 [Solanum verrucosum]